MACLLLKPLIFSYMYPLWKVVFHLKIRQQRYNTETESAMREARAIANGLIPAKKYSSAAEMINDALE